MTLLKGFLWKVNILTTIVVLCILVLGFGSVCGSAECSPELLGKKVVVILGSGSLEATPEVLAEVIPLLEAPFLNKQFQVIDQATLNKIIPEQEKQLLLRGDTVGAVTISEKLGADLLLMGQMSLRVKALESLQTNLKSIYVTLSLKLLYGKTAQALSSKTWSGKSAGADIAGTAVSLVGKNSEAILEDMFSDYCARAASILGEGKKETSSGREIRKEDGEGLNKEEGRDTTKPEPSINNKGKEAPSESSSSLDKL